MAQRTLTFEGKPHPSETSPWGKKKRFLERCTQCDAGTTLRKVNGVVIPIKCPNCNGTTIVQ